MDEKKDIQDFVLKSKYLQEDNETTINDISRAVRELVDRSDLYLEFMAAAFIKEVGIPASECELVMESNPINMTTKWYFRKRLT